MYCFRNLLTAFIILVIFSQYAFSADLVDLLKKGEYTYKQSDDGTCAVYVSYQGETSVIYLKEKYFGKEKNDELKYAYLYSIVFPGKKDVNFPAAELMKIAQLNDKLSFGKVSVSEEDNTIYYDSSFWLSNADEKTLANELFIAHVVRQQLKEVLGSY